MQAVPSLVGTGSAVAAAAAGLVFGQPLDLSSSSSRPPPAEPQRQSIADQDPVRIRPSISSRPGTSSEPLPPTADDDFSQTAATPVALPSALSSFGHYPPNASRSHRIAAVFSANTLQRPRSRRHSFLKSEASPLPAVDDNRDSLSSNGSWIRRLSIRPSSQHGSSARSSLCPPDSPTLAVMSNTNANGTTRPPLLSPLSPSAGPPQQRNRLVKRQPGEPYSTSTVGRRGVRTHMSSIRRPATSHQRTSLDPQFHAQSHSQFEPPPIPSHQDQHQPDAKFSFDQPTAPVLARGHVRADPTTTAATTEPAVWKSFMHSRTARVVSKGGSPRTSPRSSDAGSRSAPPAGSRKILTIEEDGINEVYLMSADMISSSSTSSIESSQKVEVAFDSSPASKMDDATHNNNASSSEETPSKPPRKSISMHFSSPTNWISRTGSIRRPKRGAGANREGGKRYVSAPATVVKDPEAEAEHGTALQEPFSPTTAEAVANSFGKHRQRNSSSPLPPISRLSSFHIDLSRVGLGSSHSKHTPTSSVTPSSQYRVPGSVGGFDADGRDCVSGDDETDFRSDTMFDSIRTVGSGRRRTVETPLESMFDETPPSTANAKAKRLSIHEMLGRSFDVDDDDKITEEEESIATPIRTAQSSSHRLAVVTGTKDDSTYRLDYARVSFESSEDDWTQEDADQDDHLANHLSPPSSHHIYYRNANPGFRPALASIGGNGGSDHYSDAGTERPRSNVFDWTEPPLNAKDEPSDRASPRPRTVHGKHSLEMRGGRGYSRRSTALHVRSQSVPVASEQPENAKSTPKFGTWATGKHVSEDWDEDFDFSEGLDQVVGDDRADSGFGMVIPTSIQASQPSVKAHSGQIREFSLLVNDLKRLCRLGRELGLVNVHGSLWKEAQGVIALASPDDDSSEDSTPGSPSSEFDHSENETTDEDAAADTDTKVNGNSLKPNGAIVNHKSTPTRDLQRTNSDKPSAIRTPRRQTIIALEDDIFGGSWPANDGDARTEPPHTPVQQTTNGNDNGAGRSHEVAFSVLEAVHQQQFRSASDPTPTSSGTKVQAAHRLNFDTNSLRELVKRAGELHARLTDIVRREDGLLCSPAGTPRHQRTSSPAFTQVFDNPGPTIKASPVKCIAPGHGSLDGSPSAALRQRLQAMTVN